MQFDWVNFQQHLQTLQFQRCECVTRHRSGGIACDIRGKLAQRESCTAARLSVARQWPGTADTADANNLSKPHCDDSRGHAQVRDETTTVNVAFSAAASRKIATQHTRCVHPPRWRPPPSTVTFPRQQADKSRHNDHVLPFSPRAPTRASSRRPRAGATLISSPDQPRSTGRGYPYPRQAARSPAREQERQREPTQPPVRRRATCPEGQRDSHRGAALHHRVPGIHPVEEPRRRDRRRARPRGFADRARQG